jgi:tetratricopeptide (TPR) repeat protein
MTSAEQEIYEEGLRHFEHERLDEAARCFQVLVEGWPSRFADIYNRLGVIFQQKGRLDQAIPYLEKALGINPHYTEAALNLVIAYNELGHYEQARQVFDKAVKVVQTEPDAIDPYIQGKMANRHAQLADQYYDLHRFREAIGEYKKALSLRPRFIDIAARLAMAYRESGAPDLAIKTFQKVLKVNPRYTLARTHLGITYYTKGFVDMAVTEWEKALEMDPQNHDVRVYLSLVSKSPL